MVSDDPWKAAFRNRQLRSGRLGWVAIGREHSHADRALFRAAKIRRWSAVMRPAAGVGKGFRLVRAETR